MTLTLHILEFLRAAGDMLTPESQLRTDVRLSVAPPPTGSEISESLNMLEKEGWAVSMRDKLTGQIRWTITDEGRAQLAKRHL